MSDDAFKRFTEFVKLQAYDDKYIDRQEERRIVEEAVKMGFGVEDGLTALRKIAAQNGIALEREIEDQAKRLLEQFASDGKIDKKEFNDVVQMFRKGCKGKIPEHEAKRRIKQMVLDNGWKAKEGGLFGSNWFSEI